MPPPAALRWLATAILLIPPSHLAAQLVERGDRIRIRDGAASRWIPSTVTTADSSLISPGLRQRWVDWRQLSGLQSRRGRTAIDAGKIGAAVGILAGFGYGIYDSARRDCLEPGCVDKVLSYMILPTLGAMGGAVIGFGVGALIGAVVSGDRWDTLVAMPGSGTVQVGVSVAF